MPDTDVLPAFLRTLDDDLPACQPLREARFAILEAIARKDVQALADSAGAHAAEVERLARESPLRFAERGDPDAAIWLATVGDPDQAVARLLLLAWHFTDRDDDASLERTVHALTTLRIPPDVPRPAAIAPSAAKALIDRCPALAPWIRTGTSTRTRLWGDAELQAMVGDVSTTGRLDDAKDAITGQRFGQDVPEAWRELIEALVAAGQADLAREAVNELRESIATLHSSRWIRAQYWPDLARALALVGETDAAIAATGDDAAHPYQRRAREGMVDALVERGDAAIAIRFAHGIGDVAGRYDALCAAGFALAAAGDNDAARSTLAEAQATVVAPVWIATPIAGRFMVALEHDVPEPPRRGKRRSGVDIDPAGVADALQQAGSIRDAALRAETLTGIALVQAAAGEIAGAWATRNLACETAGTAGASVQRSLRTSIVRAQAVTTRQALETGWPDAAGIVIATACDSESAAMLADALAG